MVHSVGVKTKRGPTLHFGIGIGFPVAPLPQLIIHKLSKKRKCGAEFIEWGSKLTENNHARLNGTMTR